MPWNVTTIVVLIGNPGVTLLQSEPGGTFTTILSLPAITGNFVTNDPNPVQFVNDALTVKVLFFVADGVSNNPGLLLSVAPGGFGNGPVPTSHVGFPPGGTAVVVVGRECV